MIITIDPATQCGWATERGPGDPDGGCRVVVASGVLDLEPAHARAAVPARPAVVRRGRPGRPARLAKRDGRVLEAARPAEPDRIVREAREAVPAVPAEPKGVRYGRLLRWLHHLAAGVPREGLILVSEAPLKGHMSAPAAEVAFGLAGVLRAFGVFRCARHVEIDPYDLQRWFVGRRADSNADEMMTTARARGLYDGTDHNEADARILLAWARAWVVREKIQVAST